MAHLSRYALERRAFLREICPDRKCHHCRRKAPSWASLEVDHLDGKGWVASKVNSWQRLRIMRREVAANLEKGVVGRLVGSCGHCNKSSSSKKRYRWQIRRKRKGGGVNYSNWAVRYASHLAEQHAREHGHGNPAGGVLVAGDSTAHPVE